MNTLFTHEEALTYPGRMLGQYSWPTAITLSGWTARYRAPLTRTVVRLYLDETPSVVEFAFEPGDPGQQSIEGPFIVPAGKVLTWRVTEGPSDAASAASEVGITVLVVPGTNPAPSLQVRWEKGDERFWLWAYDSSTGTWSCLNAILAAGRIQITDSPFCLRLDSGQAIALRTSGNALEAYEYVELGYPATEPAAAFYRGVECLARLTDSSFWVSPIKEDSSVASGNGFQFHNLSGQLVAELDEFGLKAITINERKS